MPSFEGCFDFIGELAHRNNGTDGESDERSNLSVNLHHPVDEAAQAVLRVRGVVCGSV